MFNKVFKALRFFSTIKHCKLFKDEPSKYTQLLSLQKNSSDNKIFRLIDLSGNLLNESFAKNPIFFKIYETMVKTEEMDNILNLAQAKGQLIFYITSFGEVATTVASTAALNESDLIFPQYREQGSLLWRGFGINECTNQCVGNCLDLDKGRQMPMNYGAKRLNFVTVSAPLGFFFILKVYFIFFINLLKF